MVRMQARAQMKTEKTYRYLIGVDEVGRGPIAGPVTIAFFVVPWKKRARLEAWLQARGAKDSKQLSEKKREAFVAQVKREMQEKGAQVFIRSVPASFIDRRGIREALSSAMRTLFHAMKKKGIHPEEAFFALDASLPFPHDSSHYEHIVKGDAKNRFIGAASIFAKVHRDALMKRYAQQYPLYNFAKHKGYGTKEHYRAIQQHGLSPLHRKTWIQKD